MKAKTIKIERECQSCDATGLYVGLAERRGMAVECRTCEGSGREVIIIERKPFTGRKKTKGIKRVLKVNPGIVAAYGVTSGGVSYADWMSKGFPKRGAEMRSHTCPAWWYQSEDYDRKPDWRECTGMGAFSDCSNFSEKGKCWERFDREKL